jgi:hypothetical protein
MLALLSTTETGKLRWVVVSEASSYGLYYVVTEYMDSSSILER